MCPVLAFKKYIDKLHPDQERMWQRPLDSVAEDDPVWFCNMPSGKDIVGGLMGKISDAANLSLHYTNHCIRTTAICALDNAGYDARHIMQISGHKCEASIRSYAHFLPSATSRKISGTLAQASRGQRLVPQQLMVEPGPSTTPLMLQGPVQAPNLALAPAALGRPQTQPQLSLRAPESPPFRDLDCGPSSSPLLTSSQYDMALANLDVNTIAAPQNVTVPGTVSNMNWTFRNQQEVNCAPNITNCIVNINYNNYGK